MVKQVLLRACECALCRRKMGNRCDTTVFMGSVVEPEPVFLGRSRNRCDGMLYNFFLMVESLLFIEAVAGAGAGAGAGA